MGVDFCLQISYKVHSFLKQCFARSLIDTIFAKDKAGKKSDDYPIS